MAKPSTMRSRQKTRRPEITNLSGLVEALEKCCVRHAGEPVTVAELLDVVGRRSFGPLILMLGLIGISPVSNIPGVVAVVAILDLLVIGEILIGMDHVWFPKFMAERSFKSDRLERPLRAMRGPAKFIDRFLEPRLTFLTEGPFFYILTFSGMLVAIALPIIEIIPLAGIIPNAALVAFGLAITAHDGLWAIIGLLIIAASAYLFGMIILSAT